MRDFLARQGVCISKCGVMMRRARKQIGTPSEGLREKDEEFFAQARLSFFEKRSVYVNT